jgi:hypothetical protein
MGKLNMIDIRFRLFVGGSYCEAYRTIKLPSVPAIGSIITFSYAPHDIENEYVIDEIHYCELEPFITCGIGVICDGERLSDSEIEHLLKDIGFSKLILPPAPQPPCSHPAQ